MGSRHKPVGAFDVERICIIGAGPSGLASAKYLLAENAFGAIDILEQRTQVGGVWNYNAQAADKVEIPQTSPYNSVGASSTPVFSTPMYDHLHTNIPRNLMAFSDLAFPNDSLLFPTREDVQDYLLKYSEDVRHLIKFSTQVQEVRHSLVDGKDRWTVVSRLVFTNELQEVDYDALVIANGHYAVPFLPEVPGIEQFNRIYPEVISHCKSYRSPAPYVGKKVIVVGNGPSGLDIGTQISTVCETPLLHSVRSPSNSTTDASSKADVAPIAEFLPENRSVRFADGMIAKDIDKIVYCTGYLYSYPFLSAIKPPIVTDGRRARGLYKHLFNVTHPTVVFTALPQRVIPFPLSEVQAAAIAKVWANKLALPSEEEMIRWEENHIQEAGDGTSFHLLPYPKDAAYLNELHDWVGTSEDGFAKEPAYWTEKECWVRENFAELRRRFAQSGGKAKTMEELGFDFNSRKI